MKKIVLFSLSILVISSWAYAADQPLENLRVAVDKAMEILGDPRFDNGASKQAQRDEIWEVIRQVFDLEGIAKITLGRNWQKFSQSEKEEFTEVFGRFLGNNYVDKIQTGYSGEKVSYLEEEIIDDRRAIVETKIIREATEIPVNYRMHKTGEGWRVYDVIIEGVSLIKNYRTQFNSILMKDSPRELIETIRKKL